MKRGVAAQRRPDGLPRPGPGRARQAAASESGKAGKRGEGAASRHGVWCSGIGRCSGIGMVSHSREP